MGCAARARKGMLQKSGPNAQINQGGGHDAGGKDEYDGRANTNGDTPGAQDTEANNGSFFQKAVVISTS